MDQKQYSSYVDLVSDSETEKDNKNTTLNSSFEDKKETSYRLEPRATRSQTQAEGGVKQLNDTKLSDGKKERESLRQQSGESQINITHLIDDDLLDIDQIEVKPLSSVQDEIQTQTPPNMTRSSLQRLRLSNPGDNLLTNNKVNSKETSNKKVEKITIHPDYNCLLGKTKDEVSVEMNAFQDAITLRKDSSQNTLTTYDGKLLKQKGIFEIKGSSIRCIDSRKDSTFVSLTNHPMVVYNKIKKPFNMKFVSEQINKTVITLRKDSLQNTLTTYNGTDEVINDDININIDDRPTMDTVVVNQGDSSVSESDSTIGAFDTFAQITRVRQKSFTSKDIKDTKESKTTNQGETCNIIKPLNIKIPPGITLTPITFEGKVMMKREEEEIGINRNNMKQIIANEYLANMESYCKKNQLTTTLVKKEPIDEYDDDILENDTNIERELIESRKAPTNDDFETFNLRERGIRKCMGPEGKTSKEIETNSTEVKMITKTRGLKVEEKLKESYVYKNVSTQLRPQIIANEYLANMESFCKKNQLTMKLVKDEPIDEYDDDILENDTNIERELIEGRKAPTNDDFETFNLRERGIRKCMGPEGKTSKEIETNSTEVKMITKTRGLKVEEKLKESYVYKNVSTKLRPQIKSLGSPSYSASLTSIENPSIPSYENKKKNMNTDDNSKRNTTSNTLYDYKNNRDINIDPSVIVRKENLNRAVIGIPRTLTLSSSFKQKITSETTSSKQDQDNVIAIIPKETVLTKTIVSTSTYPNHQTTRSKSPPKTNNEHTLNEINCGRTLFTPLEMLSKSQIPLHKVHQRSVNNFIKQQEIKPRNKTSQKVAISNTSIEEVEPIAKRTRMSLQLRGCKNDSVNKTHDQIQTQTKQFFTTKDKPPPKKRGRKRRIDLQNKKQESNSKNRTSQNVAKCNTSIKEVEPPAKRTRRSLGLRGRKNEAMNNYAQPRSTTVEPRQSKKQCVEKSNETCKRLMKFVFDNLCEKIKYISTLNKEVTDIPPSYAGVIKCPIETRDIKRKIATGEIKNLTELQVNLLLLSYNAQMVNRSDSIVFNDASQFQFDLQNNCRELKDALAEHYGSGEDGPIKELDYSINDLQFPDLKSKPCSNKVIINKETIKDILRKYVDLTSDESTDSDDND